MKSMLLDQKPRRKKSVWREYAEALIVALVLALIIRTFVVQAFKIPSESMLQTLQVGDHLLASKFAYGLKIPRPLSVPGRGPPAGGHRHFSLSERSEH